MRENRYFPFIEHYLALWLHVIMRLHIQRIFLKIQIGKAAIKYYYNALSSGSFSEISATSPALANAL